MNKGCYGSSAGIIIAQFKDCGKGIIFKSLSVSREKKIYMKRKSTMYASTNTVLYSPLS